MRPALTGVRWADWLIVAAAILTALGAIWRIAVRPVVRAARLADAVLPTLIDIGKQFHEDGGHTLKDSLNRIEGVQAEQGGKLDSLYTYAHDSRHLQAGQIAGLAKFDEGITRQITTLAAHLEPVPAKLDAIAVAAGAADDAAVEHRESHPESPGE